MSSFKEQENDFIRRSKMLELNSKKDICKQLLDDSMPSLPNGAYKEKVLCKILDNYENQISMPSKTITFYSKEIEFLKSIEDLQIKESFYCLLLWTKINYHSSGYINLDLQGIYDLFPSIKGISDKERANRFKLCYDYGFIDMRVIGKKEPIPCFKLMKYFGEGEAIYEIQSSQAEKFFKDRILC